MVAVRYGDIAEISGDLLKLRVPPARGADATAPACLGDLALVGQPHRGGPGSLAQVLKIDGDTVSLQVFAGTKGLTTRAQVQFLGHPPRAICSENVLGRIFRGTGELIDDGPRLELDRRVEIGSPTVNPMRRELGATMIRTNVPMIDVFNALVESQKIPIFSVAGEPYNQLLSRIGIQADADVVVFGGLGLIYDDYHVFRQAFEDAGVFARTAMFVNFAADPIVERLLVPDMALAVAERFAVEEGKRVLVLLSDMTAYADALKEVGIAMEQVPANRGYTGDLYTQLARRYEKACNFASGGSLTILAATTMPGDDVTHPVPDNTGYITEGQFYLRDGMIDPFGSLSRLKQHVAGVTTREDHKDVMNVMIRLYADAKEAEQKQAMAFDLSAHDQRALAFGKLFRRRFMDLEVDMALEDALDLCWQTMAECFGPEELFVKQSLLDRYFPQQGAGATQAEADTAQQAPAATGAEDGDGADAAQ